VTWVVAIVCCVMATASCPAVASAQSSAITVETDLRLQVRAEIRRLSDSSRSVRIQAEEALLKLGTNVLPLLPPPDLLKSLSARQAIRRVRVRLEHDVAEQSLRPSTVTLAGEYSVEDFVLEIEKQTGNSILTSRLARPELDRKVNLSLQETPFWNAVRLLEADDLEVEFERETGQLNLKQCVSRRLKPVSAVDRAFRIEASAFTSQNAGADKSTLLSSQLRILCEPRLRPLFLRYRTSDFGLSMHASKNAIEPFNSGATIEVPLGNGGREAVLSLSFLSGESTARQASLHGKAVLLVAASEQPISFRGIGQSKSVSRRRGGVTVTVNEVRFEASRSKHHNARVQLKVNYDLGANAFESHQTWVFHNRVYLVDPDGHQHTMNGGFNTLYQGDGSVGIEYLFEDLPTDPANWEFVYVAPTLLINVEIPITLRDIPIVKADSKQE